MKYLENIALEKLSSFVGDRIIGDRIINGRIESFSCKRAGEDKKLSKVIDAKIVEGLSNSSNARSRSRPRSSSLGDLNSASTRRLLIDLIETLNASFPDYDFSNISPESFVMDDVTAVAQRINSYLAEITASNPDFLESLWRTIDEVYFQVIRSYAELVVSIPRRCN